MTTKPPLQNILQGILHTEDESKKKKRGQEISNTSNRRLALTQLHTIKSLNNKNS
jgi:hypothetical protein